MLEIPQVQKFAESPVSHSSCQPTTVVVVKDEWQQHTHKLLTKIAASLGGNRHKKQHCEHQKLHSRRQVKAHYKTTICGHTRSRADKQSCGQHVKCVQLAKHLTEPWLWIKPKVHVNDSTDLLATVETQSSPMGLWHPMQTCTWTEDCAVDQ